MRSGYIEAFLNPPLSDIVESTNKLIRSAALVPFEIAACRKRENPFEIARTGKNACAPKIEYEATEGNHDVR